MSGALLQAFGGLGLVIGLMFAAAWLFRRSGGLQALQRGPVRVVGGLSVGARERVVLLEVGESWIVVGVAPGQVSALHTLPRQALAEDNAAAPGAAPFQHLLARFGQRPPGAPR